MKRYNTALVLAETFGLNYSDMKDYKYQAGRSDRAIYIIDGDYYCANKIGGNPAKHNEGEFDWTECKSWFGEKIGWKVWVSKS